MCSDSKVQLFEDQKNSFSKIEDIGVNQKQFNKNQYYEQRDRQVA